MQVDRATSLESKIPGKIVIIIAKNLLKMYLRI